MWWLWNKRAYATGAFGAYELWVIVDWSLPESILAVELGTAEYAGLSFFGAACIAITVAPWLNALRPSMRVRKLAPDIERAMQSNVVDLVGSRDDGLESPIATSSTRAHIIELAHVLDKNEIPHPPLKQQDSMNLWYRFLPDLLGAARAGRMKEAKTVWANMERQKRGGGE